MIPSSQDLAPLLHGQTALPSVEAEGVATTSRNVEQGEVRVVVAASVRLYRDGIALSLRQQGIQVVALVSNAHETLAAVAASPADVVLLDVSMEGAHDVVRALVERTPGIMVVAFAVDDGHDDAVLACAEMGVAGWVGRDGSLTDLIEAIRNAARGELVCSARMAGLMARRLAVHAGKRPVVPNGTLLTPRELEIAELLRQGMSNKHIARTLSLQLATVKNHVHNILAKLGANSRSEAGARLREVVPPARGSSRPGS
jgi:DNA-binding NarL/FixJ family response regulator